MLRPKLPQPQMNESQLEHTLHLTTSIKTQSCKTNSWKPLCIIFKEFDCQDAYKCKQREVLTLPPTPHTHTCTHIPILIQREFSEVYICVTTVTEILKKTLLCFLAVSGVTGEPPAKRHVGVSGELAKR